MKQIVLCLLCISTLLISCKPEPQRRVEKEWTPEQPKLVAWYLPQDGDTVKIKEEQYYEDGKTEFTGDFDPDGVRHGEWKYYYPNGNIWSIGRYDHGKKVGKKEVYWPDGTIRYEGNYIADKKSGTWVFYNMDGTVLQEMNFDGEENGAAENGK